METIDKIQNELREGLLNNNPSQCSDYVALLSGEISFYISQSAELEKNKPEAWLKLRETCKSDAATDRKWDLTEEGIKLTWYNSRIKRCAKLIDGLKTIIKKCEMEQKNLQ